MGQDMPKTADSFLQETEGERAETRPAQPEDFDSTLETWQIVEGLGRLGLSETDIVAATGANARAVRRWRAGQTEPVRHWKALDDLRWTAHFLSEHRVLTDRGIVAWLRSRNRLIGDRRPLEAIAEGSFDEVRDAAYVTVGQPRPSRVAAQTRDGAEAENVAAEVISLNGAASSRSGASSKTKAGAMPRNERHVVPSKQGGWDVVKPGSSRASSHHDTQAGAETLVKEILGGAGGGEAVIHGRDGRVRDSDTVAPGNDPNPPRDRKH